MRGKEKICIQAPCNARLLKICRLLACRMTVSEGEYVMCRRKNIPQLTLAIMMPLLQVGAPKPLEIGCHIKFLQ